MCLTRVLKKGFKESTSKGCDCTGTSIAGTGSHKCSVGASRAVLGEGDWVLCWACGPISCDSWAAKHSRVKAALMPYASPVTSALHIPFQEHEDSNGEPWQLGVGVAGRGGRSSDGLHAAVDGMWPGVCISSIALECNCRKRALWDKTLFFFLFFKGRWLGLFLSL